MVRGKEKEKGGKNGKGERVFYMKGNRTHRVGTCA
jgi:hypothetical protein